MIQPQAPSDVHTDVNCHPSRVGFSSNSMCPAKRKDTLLTHWRTARPEYDSLNQLTVNTNVVVAGVFAESLPVPVTVIV